MLTWLAMYVVIPTSHLLKYSFSDFSELGFVHAKWFQFSGTSGNLASERTGKKVDDDVKLFLFGME